MYLLPASTWPGRDKLRPKLLVKFRLEGGDFGSSVSRDSGLVKRIGEAFVLVAWLHRESVVEGTGL